jgi:putative nucleotidyltransferase with HDIG domain
VIEVEQCLPLVEEISGSVARNSTALISLARLKSKDEYTYMHSVSVCALMIALARQMQLDEQQTQQAGVAGLLHDIGKMAMPEKILNKPGALTTDEFSVIRLHPERGHAILTRSGFTAPSALDVCLHHHEKIDGSGYPYGLKGEQISQLARMGAVCDVYDAITSNRPYKNGWDEADSLARMAKWEGHFDTAIFHAFVKMVGIYPLGSLVRLHSGRLGVIVEQNPQSLTRPLLKVFFSTRTNMPIPVQLLDLSKSGQTDTIVNREDPQKWQFSNLNALWQG